jgi:site-specific recombinase XerC
MNNPLATLFDQFLKERTCLKNVTPSTLIWYRVAFKNYAATIADDAAPLPTKATMQQFVIKQRERGLRPVTVNTYLGAMNAFCAWLHQKGHVTDRVKLPKLRVERRLLSLVHGEFQIREHSLPGHLGRIRRCAIWPSCFCICW